MNQTQTPAPAKPKSGLLRSSLIFSSFTLLSRFMGFAGFFGPGDLELIRCEAHTGQIIPTCFIFDLPGAPQDSSNRPFGEYLCTRELP